MTVLVAISTVKRAAERAKSKLENDGMLSRSDPAVHRAAIMIFGAFITELAEEMKNPRDQGR